ncbi:hypothetical protein A9975_01485 [Cupriavidus sp. UME77]|nr:hypothetical protein [Cupriavidus sp. UME77]
MICAAALALAQTGCLWVPGGEGRTGGYGGYRGEDRHDGHPGNEWNNDHRSADHGQAYSTQRNGDNREHD